jgi:hypothetical protein
MYSLLYSDERSWLRLYGVTDRGAIPLRGERDFAPFDEAAWSWRLNAWANMRFIWLAELLTNTPPTRLGAMLAQSAWLSQYFTPHFAGYAKR